MNKRLIISFGLFVLLALAATLINLNRPADAAYLPGASSQWVNNGSDIYYSNGNVGIGATGAPTKKLEVTGSIKATEFVYSSSDRNLKKNVETISNPLEKIMKLRGVTFDWKKDNSRSIGLIAQEVEQVFPELVSGQEGDKSVAYSNLVAPLIEAVKMQQAEIEALKIQVANLSK